MSFSKAAQRNDAWHRAKLELTRRHFLVDCPIGLGAIALWHLLRQDGYAATTATNPLAPRAAHFAPRARAVIYLFMAGGPSHLELFDYKPALQRYDGQPVPASFVEGKRFAFIKKDAKLLGTKRKFYRWGNAGAEISELLPHIGSVADEICIIRSMVTEVFNHGPAKLFMNTGTAQFGRPSMGAWVTWGIGSEASDLPGFVVLQSGPRGPRGGAPLWGSGFLPTTFQGVPFLPGPEPILNLANPPGIDRRKQRQFIQTVNRLNRQRLALVQDPEIATRIAQYEMAFRMQVSAPRLMDLSDEDKRTLELYGVEPGKPSFAMNCLLARRLVERGVRFVQLYHTDWDHHGSSGLDLGKGLERVCREVDRPAAALVKDLKQRGLLEETLVIWGGEFGRTPMGEQRESLGRDHHIDGFTVWLAGGGVRPGMTYGATDELGFYAVENPVHVHDLHATVLHLLGLDHTRLTYRFQGREFRLTDIGGRVVQEIVQ